MNNKYEYVLLTNFDQNLIPSVFVHRSRPISHICRNKTINRKQNPFEMFAYQQSFYIWTGAAGNSACFFVVC